MSKPKQDAVYEEVQEQIKKLNDLFQNYVENGSNYSNNIRIVIASRALNAFYVQWFLSLGDVMKERIDALSALDKRIEEKQNKPEQQP